MCTKFDDFSFSRFTYIIGGLKIWNASQDPDHAPSKEDLSAVFWDLIYPTRIRNLITVASAVSEIWLVPTKIWMVHVTWPRPFRGCFIIFGLGLATVNLPIKFEVSVFAHYKDMKTDSNSVKKYTGFWKHRHSIDEYQFLLAFHSNYVPILHSF